MGLFCSWQGVPPQSFERSVWDCVGFYMIHTFLNPSVECQVKSFLKLIISFLVLPLVLLKHYQLLPFMASTRHAQLTSRVYLRLAIRPSAQFANLLTRTTSKQQGPLLPFFKSRKGISCTNLHPCILRARSTVVFFPTTCSMQETKKNYYQQATYKDQIPMVLNEAPHSSFKKLIVLMSLLLQGLHMMSLEKSVPEGLKPQECERTKLREPPPVPYVPVKDEVQEKAAKMRNLQIKTLLLRST
jgi:hypothetical protein